MVSRSGESMLAGDRVRVNRSLSIPVAEIRFRTSRSSGPGGQHANKTESRGEALFDVRGSQTLTDAQKERVLDRIGETVRAAAQDERSQLRNKQLASQRLAAQLAAALKTEKKRLPIKKSPAATEKRLQAKRERSEIKRMRRKAGDE